jgi:glutamate/tyrosine decarboxylase-like PLP-dependent enzyme
MNMNSGSLPIEEKLGRADWLQEKYKRNREFEIPAEGKGRTYVKKEVENAMKRIPACYLSQQEMAKPGTINDDIAREMYCHALETANPNNVDPEMFLGSYELEREVLVMTAGLFNYPRDPQEIGGWILNGGTEAILQAVWMYRNMYFFERFRSVEVPEFLRNNEGLFRDLFSVRKNGWFRLYPEYSAYYDRHKKVPLPKILAPFDIHFALKKAADILGLGQDNIEYYFLDENGRPDHLSVREKARKIVNDGDEIIMTWVTVGDTTRGVLSDTGMINKEVLKAIKGKQEYVPPTIVDAAAQYLFAAVMDGSEEYVDAYGNKKRVPVWDFRVDNVKAIIADPHKNQIPYPASMILVRDSEDIKNTIMDTEYLSIDLMEKVGSLSEIELEHTTHSATIPTSRPGYGAVATWAYYVGHGLKKIRKRKERIWKLVMRLRNAIEEGKISHIYDLICEPDSALVSFSVSKKWVADNETNLSGDIYSKAKNMENWVGMPETIDLLAGIANHKIYESINESTKDFLYIGRSEELWIKFEEDFKEFNKWKTKLLYKKLEDKTANIDTTVYNYMGLIAHIMEHNKEWVIDLLIKRLEEEARSLLK